MTVAARVRLVHSLQLLWTRPLGTIPAKLVIGAGLLGLVAPTSAQCFLKLKASDHSGGDNFGRVALGDDLLVVGAPWHDDLGSKSGAAYVFDLKTNTEIHHLTASDGAAGDQFGAGVVSLRSRRLRR